MIKVGLRVFWWLTINGQSRIFPHINQSIIFKSNFILFCFVFFFTSLPELNEVSIVLKRFHSVVVNHFMLISPLSVSAFSFMLDLPAQPGIQNFVCVLFLFHFKFLTPSPFALNQNGQKWLIFFLVSKYDAGFFVFFLLN